MRRSFEEFKEEALKRPEVRKEYDALEFTYELKKNLIKMRKAANLTQEEVAKKMNTQKSNISRLESLNSKVMPTLETISSYALATGHQIKISFI